MKKFNTIYSCARSYVTDLMYGGRLEKQPKNNQDANFERKVYLSFKQDVQMMLGLNVDTNTWIFEQNLLKTTDRESLKSLCETFYVNKVAESLK